MTWSKVEDVALVTTLVVCFLAFATMGHCQETWRVLPDPGPRKVQFWTARRWQDPPLRKNRETLRSPWYIVPHVLAIGASVANVTRARRAGAGWGDAAAGVIPLSALGFVMDRYVWRPFSVGIAGAVIGIRGYGAARGRYR
jgi:hypothetical protein